MLFKTIEKMSVELFEKLREKCKNPNFQLSHDEENKLKELNLITKDGFVRDNIKYPVIHKTIIVGNRVIMKR